MSETRVFNVDDPEPPADVTRLRGKDGRELVRLENGGWWFTGAEWPIPGDRRGWSWPPLAEDFPFTEEAS